MKIRYWVNARPPLWTCGAIIKQEMQEEMLLSPPCCGYFSLKKKVLDLLAAPENCYCCPVYQWLVCRDCFCRSRSEAETEAGRVVFHFNGWQVDFAEIPSFFSFFFFKSWPRTIDMCGLWAHLQRWRPLALCPVLHLSLWIQPQLACWLVSKTPDSKGSAL